MRHISTIVPLSLLAIVLVFSWWAWVSDRDRISIPEGDDPLVSTKDVVDHTHPVIELSKDGSMQSFEPERTIDQPALEPPSDDGNWASRIDESTIRDSIPPPICRPELLAILPLYNPQQHQLTSEQTEELSKLVAEWNEKIIPVEELRLRAKLKHLQKALSQDQHEVIGPDETVQAEAGESVSIHRKRNGDRVAVRIPLDTMEDVAELRKLGFELEAQATKEIQEFFQAVSGIDSVSEEEGE